MVFLISGNISVGGHIFSDTYIGYKVTDERAIKFEAYFVVVIIQQS